ncbi:MAG: phosphoglucosamine mutase, partial [Clostridia bacterium]|nr:phosphoglucosamine mutase [Clostridia bacterium]
KKTLSALTEGVRLYPQYMKSVRVRDKEAVLADEDVLATLNDVRERIGGEGRVLLRPSGTEPKVRVMVECKTAEEARALTEEVCDAIRRGGHTCE